MCTFHPTCRRYGGSAGGGGNRMDMTITLAQLAGWIALLLWGVHMAQSGIQRAFGPSLRRVLGKALGNRMMAFCAGLGITAVLQSSTATALMVTSFTAGGLVDLVPALAVVLGANVGTTLIVQVMSFDVYSAAPLLVLVGVMMFRRGGTTRTRDLGRVVIGLGLILLALHQLLIVIEPFEDTPSLRLLLEAVTTDPVIAMLLATALLGDPFERRGGAAGDVLRRPRGGPVAYRPGAGARREPGNGDQPIDRTAGGQRSGDAAATDGQYPEPARLLRPRDGAARSARHLSRPPRTRSSTGRGGFSHGIQSDVRHPVPAVFGAMGLAPAPPRAGKRRTGRSVPPSPPRRGGARDAGGRARRRGARGAAHGRRARWHAAGSARGTRPGRPQAHRRNAAYGRRARPDERRY